MRSLFLIPVRALEHYVLVLALLVAHATASAQQGVLFINEAMASNSQTISDDMDEAADWIELYNAGPAPINIVGMRISDDISQPAKHVFNGPESELTVPAYGHLLLWASGDVGSGATHLGFKLSSSGEPILLTSALGQLTDMVQLPIQYTDVSYGRAGDAGAEWLYFDAPTPGAPNGTTGFVGRMDPPQFSVPAGFHSGTVELELFHSDPEAVIYYSLDGTTPGPAAAAGIPYAYKNIYPTQGQPLVGELEYYTMQAHVFTAPLSLSDPSSAPDVLSRRTSTANHYYPSDHMPQVPMRKGHVVRARAFREGYLPSEVVTNTYFFTSDGASPHSLPVISLSTEHANLFSHFDGIYNPGIDYEEWRLQNINTLLTETSPANWNRNTEFPIGVEWFPTGSSTRAVHRNAGFRLHGNYSRTFRRKSLRLYFKERYGDNSLGYPIFNTQEDTGFKRLVVHVSGNDDVSTNMRDMTLQAMVRHMNFETQDAQPAVVYIDGEFWGVHGMRERYDDKYFERVLGIPEGEIDMVERYRHATIGDSLAWSALLDQIAVEDPIDPAVYEMLRTKIDMENHVDYHIAQVFVGNRDWPHNNWKVFRKRTNGLVSGAPHGHDGRWRWIVFDLDWGFNMNTIYPPEYNFIDPATTPAGGDNTLVLRRLLRNEEYRHSFLNRACDMINSAFRPEVVTSVIEYHRDMIANDMPEHILRWPNSPWTVAQWLERVAVMFDFGAVRGSYFRQELQDHFELPGQHQLTVDVSYAEAGWVELNTIDLLASTHGIDDEVYPWTGVYFETVPVKLVAHALPGYEFSHWEGAVQGSDSTATLSLVQPASVTAVFAPVPYCASEMMHYWHFNDLSGGTLTEVPADLSYSGDAVISYEGAGAGYLDRSPEGEGTTLNAIQDIGAGHALRVRNPSIGRYLLIESPATGHRNISLSYATHRTTNGPDSQRVSFTIDPERLEWITLPAEYAVNELYDVRTYSLADSVSTYGNEHLAFKIEFFGPQAALLDGNSRLDNVAIQGRPMQFVNGILCANETHFTYEGVDYAPGDHIHLNDQSMDCDHWVMLLVSEAMLDSTVLSNGPLLSSVMENVSYQWFDCNGMIPVPGAVQQEFLPSAAGSYAVEIQDGECSLISDCHNSVGDTGTGIVVYPIPAQQTLHVALADVGHNASFILYDATGRLIQEGALRSNITNIHVGDLPSGTYLLHVRSVNGFGDRYWVLPVLK